MWHVSALYYWKSLSFYFLLSYLSRHFDICMPAYARFGWQICADWNVPDFWWRSSLFPSRRIWEHLRPPGTFSQTAILPSVCWVLVSLICSYLLECFFSNCQHSACRIQKCMTLLNTILCSVKEITGMCCKWAFHMTKIKWTNFIISDMRYRCGGVHNIVQERTALHRGRVTTSGVHYFCTLSGVHYSNSPPSIIPLHIYWFSFAFQERKSFRFVEQHKAACAWWENFHFWEN